MRVTSPRTFREIFSNNARSGLVFLADVVLAAASSAWSLLEVLLANGSGSHRQIGSVKCTTCKMKMTHVRDYCVCGARWWQCKDLLGGRTVQHQRGLCSRNLLEVDGSRLALRVEVDLLDLACESRRQWRETSLK